MTDAVQVYEGDGHPWPGAPLLDFTNMERQCVEWTVKEARVSRFQSEPNEQKKLILHLHEPDNRTIAEIVKLKKYLEDQDASGVMNIKPKVSFCINGGYTSLGAVAAPVFEVTEVVRAAITDGDPMTLGYNIIVEDLDLYGEA